MRTKTMVISAGEAYQTVFIDLYIKFLGGRKIDARYIEHYDHFSFNDGSTVLVDKIFDLDHMEPGEFFGFLSLCNTIYFGDYSKLTKEEFAFAKLSLSEKHSIIAGDEFGELSKNYYILANFHPGDIKIYGHDMGPEDRLYPSNSSDF